MAKKSKKPITNSKEMVVRNPDGTIKKGTILNPNGRPQGSLDFKTKFFKAINKIATQNNMTAEEVEEQLILVGYRKAKDGDYSFYKDIFDRVYGKALQKSDITTNGKEISQHAIEKRAAEILQDDEVKDEVQIEDSTLEILSDD